MVPPHLNKFASFFKSLLEPTDDPDFNYTA